MKDNIWRKKAKDVFRIYHKIEDEEKVFFTDFITDLGDALPNYSRLLYYGKDNQHSNKFTDGVLRFYYYDPNYSSELMSDIIMKLNKDEKLFEETDSYFEGFESIIDVANTFGIIFKEESTLNNLDFREVRGLEEPIDELGELERITANEDGNYYKIGNYKIYNCFTFNTIEKINSIPTKSKNCWLCYETIKGFYKDESRYSRFAKYACVSDKYMIADKDNITVDYPYDEYAFSLVFITVGDKGELVEVCSRYNHIYPLINQDGTPSEFSTLLKKIGIYDRVKKIKKFILTFLNRNEIEEKILGGEKEMNVEYYDRDGNLISTFKLSNPDKFRQIFKPFTLETIKKRREKIPWLREVIKTAEKNKREKNIPTTQTMFLYNSELEEIYGK